MTDQQKIDALRNALAALLRQTANPDPLHPAWKKARDDAAQIFQDTAAYRPNRHRIAPKGARPAWGR